MKTRYTLLSIVMIVALQAIVMSCQREIENVSLGIDDYYYIERMRKLQLTSAYTGNSYRWTLKTESGEDSLLSTDQSLIFLEKDEGEYHITFSLDDGDRGFKHSFMVTVLHEETEYSAYTASVYEYKPAPGQFINTMPYYEEGDTEEDMRQKAEDDLVNDVMISLGAYGGYVTFAFDHTVINVPGEKDFYIKGNAFYSDIKDYYDRQGGSSEPGIVMVAFDRNMNGIPDEDEWYELAGSEYNSPSTLKNYSITYSSPTDHTPVPSPMGFLSDTLYIPWTDNQGGSGYVAKNIYHTQSYYPEWIDDTSISFTGTRLARNGIDESGFGTYYVLYSYPWGYVDNHPNDSTELCSFDIGWAVDADGNSVELPGADFIRVYTGVNQYCGWLGETSTEIARAQDLHIDVSQQEVVDPLAVRRKENQ
ncbi:MAG: cell surface protein [Prevotellaceae bacterium]|nr:cell surface protein [Prevotellaceae bacterium]